MSWTGCFGNTGGINFCETIDTDRTYEFATVVTDTQQAEISIISDYDGPVNFTAGVYTFDRKK